MSILLNTIQGKQSPGLYQIGQEMSIKEFSQLCQKNNCQLFYIDGKKITSKAEFLEACAKAMNLPSYFGDNWDAFEDSLTDLDWAEGRRFVFFYDQPDHFAENDPEEWETAMDVFQSAIEYWEDMDTSMYVFFAN